MPKPPFPVALSDSDLVVHVKQLAERERQAIADLVAALAEFDERRLYLAAGCSSLFTYCTEVLHLSEHAAYRRIEAARAARLFPIILERLANGDINLTAVGLLKPHLTAANHRELLDAARHKSKRQVEEIVARIRPQPDVPSFVRKLPAAATAADRVRREDERDRDPRASLCTATEHNRPGDEGDGLANGGSMNPVAESPVRSRAAFDATPPLDGLRAVAESGARSHAEDDAASPLDRLVAAALAAPSRPISPSVVAPIAPERYKIQMTVGAETYARLRRAQDLLRHSLPNGDIAVVFDRALSLLVEHLERSRLAKTDRPRAPKTTTRASARPAPAARIPSTRPKSGTRRSRHIPASVKRLVWARDSARCTFVGPEGRCRETAFLQIHHLVPYADGGEMTAPNLCLRCAGHNRYEWERWSRLARAAKPSQRGETTGQSAAGRDDTGRAEPAFVANERRRRANGSNLVRTELSPSD